MSKIREAREALEAVESAPYSSRKREILQITVYVKHKDTIITALNSLERMQGVDLAIIQQSIEDAWDGEYLGEPHISFKNETQRTAFRNAAQTLADIKKEVE